MLEELKPKIRRLVVTRADHPRGAGARENHRAGEAGWAGVLKRRRPVEVRILARAGIIRKRW